LAGSGEERVDESSERRKTDKGEKHDEGNQKKDSQTGHHAAGGQTIGPSFIHGPYCSKTKADLKARFVVQERFFTF
jgi:hypothetical protein